MAIDNRQSTAAPARRRGLRSLLHDRLLACIAGMMLLFASGVQAADPRADYASLFGEEEKKVLATSATRDDVAFAAKLLARAADLKDAPELQRLVLERSVDLGQKDVDGLPTAIEATKQIIAAAKDPDQQDWKRKLVDLYALQYKKATGAKRVEAGNFILDVLQQEAEALSLKGSYIDATKRLIEGKDIARSIRSSRAEEFALAIRDHQSKQATVEKYAKLKTRLDQQGGNFELVEHLIAGYLLELDDSATALAMSATHPDRAWQTNTERAVKELQELSESDLLELAAWYSRFVVKATMPDAVRAAAYERAAAAYKAFLQNHQKQDAARLQAQSQIRQLNKEWTGSGYLAQQVLLWNTHNGPNNDRGTELVNVELIYRGRVVWAKRTVAIPWQAGGEAFQSVDLPTKLFDSLRVTIQAWRGFGGGLSEIQIMEYDRNIALGGKVSSSGIFDKRFDSLNVVDGTTSSVVAGKGYWLLPDKTTGWIEITPARIAAK